LAAKKKAAAAAGVAKAAKDSPYVRRLVEDEDLRDNIAQAYESARQAYGRLSNGKSPTKAIFDDKKLQKDLKQAADSIREATIALREAPNAKKGGGFFRKILLVSVAAGLALALSEDLRKKVLDALFGAEEEFEYTSTTTPSGAGATGGATTSSSTTASSTTA
jgi:hypothetical protein